MARDGGVHTFAEFVEYFGENKGSEVSVEADVLEQSRAPTHGAIAEQKFSLEMHQERGNTSR